MIKLPNSYMSKYKWRMFSYRTQSFFKDIFGSKAKRGSRVFSIFAVLVLFLLVISISLYGLNLKSRAENQTQISASTFLTYDGVSIHTKASHLTGGVPDYTATAKSGDTVQFTLIVSNANTAPSPVDVKFTLPTGFSFAAMVAPIPTGLPSMTGPVNSVIMWSNYLAPIGESTIIFNTTAL